MKKLPQLLKADEMDLCRSLADSDMRRLVGWLDMASFGAVRKHKDGRVYLDFGHDARIWSLPVGSIKMPLDEVTAKRVLELIRGKVADGAKLADVLAQFQPVSAKPNLIATKLEAWLDVKRREVAAGDRSPTYLTELERYAREGGHFSWWSGRSIHEVTFGMVEDWSHWLADKGLSQKSRYNVLAAFHAFLGWLWRRGELREQLREYPWPKVSEAEPAVLSIQAQRAVLDAIPEDRRGIFLAMALLGIRPGEAVSLRVSDVRDGWLTVAHARKGAHLGSPVRGTKSGAVKRLPVPTELAEWLLRVPTPRALGPVPLFSNPATGGHWTGSALYRTWTAACAKVGVSISLYNGTKHTMATDAIARGVPERSLQAVLGHANPKSTRRYARLADQALVDAIGRNRVK